MTHNLNDTSSDDLVEVYTPYITKNGKRIFKKDGGLFHFWAKPKK